MSFFTYSLNSEQFNSSIKNEKRGLTGMIGIACVLNLVSGDWKAIRLGFFVPQCVVLNSVGCSKHWLDGEVMTNIGFNRFKRLLENL